MSVMRTFRRLEPFAGGREHSLDGEHLELRRLEFEGTLCLACEGEARHREQRTESMHYNS